MKRPTHPAAAVRATRPGHTMCAAGCGWPLDPAARTGCDGNPAAFDRHPGCEPPTSTTRRSRRHLRSVP